MTDAEYILAKSEPVSRDLEGGRGVIDRASVTLAELSEMMNRSGRAMMKATYAEIERNRHLYLGYTRLEESMWMRFNRCCNAGRKIRIKARPVYIRVGNPTVSFRRAQPSTPTDVTPA